MFAHIPGLRVVMPSSPRARLRPAAGRDPRPGSGRLPRAERIYRAVQGGGRGRRRRAAARPLLRPARGPRPHPGDLGRQVRRRWRRPTRWPAKAIAAEVDRRRHAEAARRDDDPRLGREDRPLRDRPRGAAAPPASAPRSRHGWPRRAVLPAGAGRAGDGLGHGDAAAAARAALPARRGRASWRRPARSWRSR